MKYLLVAICIVIMASVANAQTIYNIGVDQIIVKEKEKTTATVFIRKGDAKKKVVKRKPQRNSMKRKLGPNKARLQISIKVKNLEPVNPDMEMGMGMGRGMEQMPGEMQEGR